jgi:hypothetical protein
MTRFFFILATLPLWGAEDATELLKRFIDAEHKNAALAKQYTFVEQVDHFSLQKNGEWKKFSAQTYEIMFVEGETYKKLTLRNDKPLEAKEAAKEKKKLEAVRAERRQQARSTLTHKVVSLGNFDDLLNLCDNTLSGDEEIRGRRAWVVVSKPKSGHVPANDHEKEVMTFEKKLWIDQEDLQLARSLSTATGNHTFLMPGTTILFDFEKINGGVWMQTGGVLDGHLQFAKIVKPAVRTEYKYTKFQKFDVESTLSVSGREPR